MPTYLDEICISAFSGEFPGAVNVESLWNLILNNQKANLTKMTDYWGISEDKIYNPSQGKQNYIYLNKGYCLQDAKSVNHAGRQVNAGKRTIGNLLNELKERNSTLNPTTGLILASSWSDESFYIKEASHARQISNCYTPEDQLKSFKSYAGINGPILGIDTACSSVLYALKMARALILSEQADSIIVLSLNTSLLPTLYLGFSQIKAFSNQGNVEAFGQNADGIIPAESSVAFLVEKVKISINNNRQPIAIIKGIGFSSDGAEGSVFAPGKQGQLTAYRRAYKHFPIDRIDYIEAHGTATKLGDATEIESLNLFFSEHFLKKKLIIGSIKNNIGHSLAAAGGPSLVKALCIVKNRKIPPQLPYETSEKLDRTCLSLADKLPSSLPYAKPISVGISSFGFGGSNAHAIIEEYQTAENKSAIINNQTSLANKKLVLNLVIVALKANFGNLSDLKLLQKYFVTKQEIPSNYFPNNRILNGKIISRVLQGKFLSKNQKIDITNFKMGPKLLSVIDPFKLLISDQVNQIINEADLSYDKSKIAVIMCCNIGGEYFNNAYKICYDHLQNPENPALNIHANNVATTLPSMLSGFAAQFFDLKGFHQNLYGSAGLIWNTLLLIPELLDDEIDTILLGGGRFISSTAELEKLSESTVTQGEGSCILAIQAKQNKQNTPLATIVSAIFNHDIKCFSEACKLAEVAEEEQLLHICELKPNDKAIIGEAQKVTGFLEEACGMETLTAILLSQQKYHAIEVRQDGKPLLWLFIENNCSNEIFTAPKESMSLPFELNFNKTDIKETKPTSEQAKYLQLILDNTSQVLLNNIYLNKKILKNILKNCDDKNSSKKLSVDQHTTLKSFCMLNKNNSQSILMIDQQNPYFFDHQLDHVPANLLLAGIIDTMREQLTTINFFIPQLHIRFLKYVNLVAEVIINIDKIQQEQYQAVILQNDEIVCKCVFNIQYVQEIKRHSEACYRQPNNMSPCSKPAILHKKHTDNILISDMSQQADKLYSYTVTIHPTHYFYHNYTTSHSALYVLEIARQFFMQVAHQYLNISLGIAMNLVDINIKLNGLLPRDKRLQLSQTIDIAEGKKPIKNNFIKINLSDENQLLGSISMVAQILTNLD